MWQPACHAENRLQMNHETKSSCRMKEYYCMYIDCTLSLLDVQVQDCACASTSYSVHLPQHCKSTCTMYVHTCIVHVHVQCTCAYNTYIRYVNMYNVRVHWRLTKEPSDLTLFINLPIIRGSCYQIGGVNTLEFLT